MESIDAYCAPEMVGDVDGLDDLVAIRLLLETQLSVYPRFNQQAPHIRCEAVSSTDTAFRNRDSNFQVVHDVRVKD